MDAGAKTEPSNLHRWVRVADERCLAAGRLWSLHEMPSIRGKLAGVSGEPGEYTKEPGARDAAKAKPGVRILREGQATGGVRGDSYDVGPKTLSRPRRLAS